MDDLKRCCGNSEEELSGGWFYSAIYIALIKCDIVGGSYEYVLPSGEKKKKKNKNCIHFSVCKLSLSAEREEIRNARKESVCLRFNINSWRAVHTFNTSRRSTPFCCSSLPCLNICIKIRLLQDNSAKKTCGRHFHVAQRC